jgi:YggT family protein
MTSTLIFVVSTLFNLYLLTFALRLLLQWVQVDKWNPLVQFVLRVTNPVVLPLRRFLPAMGRVDTATAFALLVLKLLSTWALAQLGACAVPPNVLQLVGVAVMSLVMLLLNIWFWSLLIYALLSWVGPGGNNPGAAVLEALVRPVLAPVRQVIPPIGGLDLSALFAMIALQAIMRLLPGLSPVAALCPGIA